MLLHSIQALRAECQWIKEEEPLQKSRGNSLGNSAMVLVANLSLWYNLPKCITSSIRMVRRKTWPEGVAERRG